MKHAIKVLGAVALAATPLAMPSATAAADSTWVLKVCPNNNHGCYNSGRYSSYKSCYAAYKRLKERNPKRRASCMRAN